jgi:hypothetical protein
MDAAERRRVFARAVERASARQRPSKAIITKTVFADAVARARRPGIRTQSVTPEAWTAIVERAVSRTGTKGT